MELINIRDLFRDKEEYLGNKVVCHSLPIRPGRNLAVIVEAAAVNHRQKKMGYNAAMELLENLGMSVEEEHVQNIKVDAGLGE